jgi:3-hydroxybutyrate dehydrogenase
MDNTPAPPASRPLAGKTAIVTGSTSGIGLGIARALAAQGANLVFNGLGERSRIDQLVAEVSAACQTPAIFHPADMTRPAEIRSLAAAAVERFGGVHILVNNAGVQHVAPVAEFPDDKWDQILAIDLSAAFHAAKVVLPAMRKAGWGRIVNIVSAHGIVASPFKAAYVAAKHGLVGLTKVIALETAREGITCNAVCPGYVRTPLVENQIEDSARANNIPRERVIMDVMLVKQPIKRFVEIDELAAFVAFLCGDAAGAITGSVLPMDGGWTAE